MICFVLLTKYLKTYLIAFNNKFFIEIKKIPTRHLDIPRIPSAVNNLRDIGIEASVNFHIFHYGKQSTFFMFGTQRFILGYT